MARQLWGAAQATWPSEATPSPVGPGTDWAAQVDPEPHSTTPLVGWPGVEVA